MPTTVRGSNAAAAVALQDSTERYQRASDFFKARSIRALAAGAPPAPSAPPASSIATDDGAVQFHLIGQQTADPKYSAIMQENADNLLAMGGLVHSYMLAQFPTVTTQTIDINTWVNVVGHLPDVSVQQQTSKSYTNRVVGASVSGEFLGLIAKAIITDGASILTDFNSFLQSIGGVTLSASNKSESYSVATCTYLSYLTPDPAGGFYDYSAIALRQVKFLEQFQEISTSCASAEYVNINLQYDEVMFLVNSRRIRTGGPDEKSFKDLIDANATAQFKGAKNFFNAGNTSQNEINPVV